MSTNPRNSAAIYMFAHNGTIAGIGDQEANSHFAILDSVMLEHEQEEVQEHVVWVGRAPAGLCAREEAVRALFKPYGTLRSVKIHHNFEDMSTEGFMFLGFATREAAERAIAAVQTRTLDEASGGSRFYDNMAAKMALKRGGGGVSQFDGTDQDIADLLLGRRQMNLANPFSQRSTAEDEDDLMLQSLSQSAFGLTSSSFTSHSQNQKKKKSSKHRRRERTGSFLSVADE